MRSRLSDRKPAGPLLLATAAAGFFALLAGARSAHAYIDPGTGGAIFSSLAPIIGVVGVVLVAGLAFFRSYVRLAVSWLGRHRLVLLALLVGIAAGVVVFVLLERGGAKPGPARARAQTRKSPPTPATLSPLAMEIMKEVVKLRRKYVRPADAFRLFRSDQYPELPRLKYGLGRRYRNCFVFKESKSVETAVVPQRGQRLLFYVGAQGPEEGWGGRVAFALSGVTDNGQEVVLFSCTWDNEDHATGWRRVYVDLDRYSGQTIRLLFQIDMDGTWPGIVCLVSDPRLTGPAVSGRPNAILYSIETLRRDHMSLYGYERKTTPFLEELSGEAVVFTDAYSQSSWTRPSVATMLSGLHPSEHGALLPMHGLGDALVLLPEVLRDQGYVTAAFCTNSSISEPIFNHGQGFDLFVQEPSNHAEMFLPEDLLEWLEVKGDEPFFVFIHTYDPHDPYEAPERVRETFSGYYRGQLKGVQPLSAHVLRKRPDLSAPDVNYVKARYDAEILHTDTILAQLVEGLRQRGLWDSTLLVITSDHGEEFYEHGDWGHGRDLLPEKLRVPLLMKLPGRQQGGRRISGPAGNVDLMPTILGSLEIPPPAGTGGINLLAALETGETGSEHHFAEFESYEPSTAGITHYSVISNRYQYIVKFKERLDEPLEELLFDLMKDPAAQSNVASEFPEVLERYAELVRRRFGQTGYTIAVNGAAKGEVGISGTVWSEAPIVEVQQIRTEGSDSYELDAEKTTLRFHLTVGDDDDVLRFQTDPSNAPVTIAVERDGGAMLPEFVRLGRHKQPCGQLPVKIPAARCAADIGSAGAVKYLLGHEPGVFIWRQGLLRSQEAEEVEPDEETLQELRDLGYIVK